MSGHILGVGHVGALDLGQGEVLQGVDRGHAIGIQDVGSGLVAGIGVKLLAPGSLHLGRAEPLGEGLDRLGLLGGTAGLVQDAQILGDIVGTVVDFHQSPVLGLQGALQRIGGALRGGIDLAVQGGGIEGGDLDVALVQRNEAVLVVVAAGLAVGAVIPQGLPALDAHAAGGGGGIHEGKQHGGVDVGVGGAAHLILAVPSVAGVHHISPVLEVQLLALGAQIIGTVEHQDVLDDQTVGIAGIGILAHLCCPGGSPLGELQVLILTGNHLAPAGLVQAEQDVAVLVLVGGLDGGGVAGDDGVVVNGDGEAGILGFVDQPGGALGGVGVGVDADCVAGIILFGLGGSLGGSGDGGIGGLLSGRLLRICAGSQGQHHAHSQKQNEQFLHMLPSPFQSGS